MTQLTKLDKDTIIKYKNLLQKNDLDAFYKKLSINRDIIQDSFERIGSFLDESGVEFEKYLDRIPFYFCCTPKHWINSGQLNIPGKIKKIDSCGFVGIQDIISLNAEHIEEIGYSILSESSVAALILGDKLKSIDGEAFEESSLELIQIPESLLDKEVYNHLEMALRDVPNCRIKVVK